ncbi:MAG TPA: hypothetical protein DD671_19820 [Balneolaceae bacterium]|nr:hypothetical protein [Balneolaceae bacterium]
MKKVYFEVRVQNSPYDMKSLPILIFAGVFIFSCTQEQNSPSVDPDRIPKHIQNMDHVSIVNPDNFPTPTISIQQDRVFSSTEDIYFWGVGSMAVDDQGRLFIEPAGEMRQSGILVFNKDGSYETTLGRYGRGPGEFEMIQDLQVWNNRLYVLEKFDIHIFNLDDLTLIETFVIDMNSISDRSILRTKRPGEQLYVLNEDSLILEFVTPLPFKVQTKQDSLYYALINSEGHISSEPFWRIRAFTFFNITEGGNLTIPLPFALPFTRSSQLAIFEENKLYSNWNEEVLIKQFDETGQYQRALYMPFQNITLTQEEAYDIAHYEKRIEALKEETIPASWPAVHRIHTDAENRLWISTITESDSLFTWYVVDDDFEPVATFNLKGQKRQRAAWHPKDLIIKNDYLYQIQSTGVRESGMIIRYNIDWLN